MIADYTDLAEVGKACVAQALLRHELEDVLRRRSGNWYDLLIPRLDAEVKGNRTSLIIVTFNYDRSLDRFLCDLASARYKRRYESRPRELVPVFHVHGHLGFFEHETTAEFRRRYSADPTPEEIRRAGEGIKVPFEITNDHGHDMLEAGAHIRKAKNVFFLGFGYDELNLDRLGVTDPFSGNSWVGEGKFFGTAFGLSGSRRGQLERESERRLKLGETNETIEQFLQGAHRWNDV